jgi:hypothetical protein
VNLSDMKIISIFFTTLFLASMAIAQTDSWKIFHNKNLLLSTSTEDESKNVKHVKKTEFDKSGELSIEYKAAIPDKEWQRTFSIVDEKDSVLFEKTGVDELKISNSTLKKFTGNQNKIRIYTWLLPKDAAKAALIRIRRVHLCTIEF